MRPPTREGAAATYVLVSKVCQPTNVRTCIHVESLRCLLPKTLSIHLGSAGVDLREIDGAGVEIDEGHGNTLSLQSGEVTEDGPAELEAVDRGISLGATDAEDEILRVEQGDFLLNGEEINAK